MVDDVVQAIEPWALLVVDGKVFVDVAVTPGSREWLLCWAVAAAFYPLSREPVQADGVCRISAAGVEWLEGEPDAGLAARLAEVWAAYEVEPIARAA